jgi:hypothetical protein
MRIFGGSIIYLTKEEIKKIELVHIGLIDEIKREINNLGFTENESNSRVLHGLNNVIERTSNILSMFRKKCNLKKNF